MRVLLWGTTLAIVLVTAFLIVFGYYWTTIKPRGRTVLQVGNETISYSDMKRRMAYEYYTTPSIQNDRSIQVVPVIAYENLINELTLVSRKAELGIDYTPEEFDAAMRAEVGVTAEATDEEFGQRLRAELETNHLHEDEFRRTVEAKLLEEKLKAKILTDAGDAVPQARVEAIVVNTREEADAAIARINAGEEWAVVAKELSEETDVETTGGLKPFQPQGGHPNVYDGYAFSAEIGAVSGPLAEQPDSETSRYWIVRVVERSEQPLTEEQKSGYQNREYQRILENTRANMTIVDNWSEDFQAQSDALAPLVRDLARLQEQQRNVPTVVIPTPPAAAQTPSADATSAAPAPSPVP